MLPDVSVLPLLFLAGMLITLSPCILPVLPVMAASGLAKHRYAPVLTGLGLAIGFALMGASVNGLLQLLDISIAQSRPVFAIIILLLGVMLVVPAFKSGASSLLAPLAAKADNLASRLEQKPGGALWLGLLLGAIWSPCAGPVLGAALSFTNTSASIVSATLQMFVFGLGAALPLIIVAYLMAGSAHRFLPKFAAKGERGRQILGYSLILVALLILTNLDQTLLVLATENLPASWLELITRY